MKKLIHYSIVLAASLFLFAGCGSQNQSGRSEIVAEGIIYTVSYTLPDGRTGGFTRVNHAKAVPGGNGSWNVDAYGKLTKDFLIITRPQRSGLGPRLIPVGRLLDLQFGDGGIVNLDENQPQPAS